jgi:hypothetical protein
MTITEAPHVTIPTNPLARATAAEAFDVSRTYGDKLVLDGAHHQGDRALRADPRGSRADAGFRR